MQEQLQSWWQNATPETQGYVHDTGIILIALLGGAILGSVVARALRAEVTLPGAVAGGDVQVYVVRSCS